MSQTLNSSGEHKEFETSHMILDVFLLLQNLCFSFFSISTKN